MKIRAVIPSDRPSLLFLFEAITIFTLEERLVAIELLDIYLEKPHQQDYFFFITQEDNTAISSFICFGPTPMAQGTYDLYWIGTHPNHTKKGLARSLVQHMIGFLGEQQARLIRVETSGQDLYNGTCAFYQNLSFKPEARIDDFYKMGDDLIIYIFRIPRQS